MTVKWMGWKPDKPDHRDKLFAVQAVHLPRRHIFDPRIVPPIRNQGEQGSCTGHSGRSVVECVRRYVGQQPHELSPRFIYWNGRKIEGATGSDDGAEIRDVVKGVVKKGAAQERDCRYNERRFKTKPAARAFKNALQDVVTDYMRVPQTLDGIKGALAANFPIWFGFSCYENFGSGPIERDGLLGMPQGKVDGGHAVWALGYDDDQEIEGVKGAVLIGNSWGTDWGCKGPTGERGYFWMPYHFITSTDLCDDLWTIRKVT